MSTTALPNMFGLQAQAQLVNRAASQDKMLWTFESAHGLHGTNPATLTQGDLANRINCNKIRLLNAQVPDTQLLVEQGINDMVYFQDQPIRLTVPTPQDASQTLNLESIQMRVDMDGTTHISTIIPNLNPIVSMIPYTIVSRPTGRHILVSTLLPHGLHLLSTVTWGAPEIVNTGVTSVSFAESSYQVYSATSFVLYDVDEGTFARYISVPSLEAHVWLPAYPDVQCILNVILADFVSHGVRNLEMQHWDGHIHIERTDCAVPFTKKLRLFVPSTSSLPGCLGFLQTGATGEVVSQVHHQFLSRMRIPAGNYYHDPMELTAAMEQAYNSLHLVNDADGGLVTLFDFVDTRDTRHTIQVLQGNYGANELAQVIQTQLNDFESDPTCKEYQVSMHSTKGVTFALQVPNAIFSLDFRTSASTIVEAWGMMSILYQGSSVYTSRAGAFSCPESLLYLDDDDIPQTRPYRRYNNHVTFHVDNDSVLHVLPAPQASIPGTHITTSLNTDAGDHVYRVTVSQQRNIVQSGDVVTVLLHEPPSDPAAALAAASVSFKMVTVPTTVQQVTAQSHWGLQGAFLKDAGTIRSITSAETPCFRFAFQDIPSAWGTNMTRAMGLHRLGLFDETCYPVYAPHTVQRMVHGKFPMDLSMPNFLVVQMQLPGGGSTHHKHIHEKQALAGILAVLDTTSTGFRKIDRHIVGSDGGSVGDDGVSFLGVQGVTSIKLALLNPDHSLYQLHGKSWSGTLCLDIVA
jgi:hypothetical protein